MAIHPADRIIVALDGMAPDQALAFAGQVEGLCWVKVGLELFVQAGPEVVAQPVSYTHLTLPTKA